MSISQVRTYINTHINTVEPDYIEWLDALNVDNIPQTLIDKRYHILIGASTITHNDNIVDHSVPATITIFKRAFNDTTGARDSLLDAAHCILMELVNPKNVESFSADIKDAEGVSIEAEEIDDSNDNVIAVEIELNFRLVYCAV